MPYRTPPPPPYGQPQPPPSPRTPNPRTSNPQGYRGVGSPPPPPQPQAPQTPSAPTLGQRAGQWAGNRASALGTALSGRAKEGFKRGGRRIGPVAGVLEGLSAGEDIMRGTPEGAGVGSGNVGRGLESAGRLAAILGGAKVGAAGGTMVMPGWGTAIGGLGGAILGGITYDSAGRAIMGELPSEERVRLRMEAQEQPSMMPGFNPAVSAMGRGLSDAYTAFRDYQPPADEPTPDEPSAISAPTIYRGQQGGQTYLSNVPFEGGVAEPDFEQRMGAMTVVPSSFFTNRGPTPQANVDAIRAAAARGDWDALERIGAISPREPRGGRGGGGGLYMPEGPDMLGRSDALMQQADEMYDRADRARSLTERSRYLKQARALMGMAENSQGQASNIYNVQSASARAAMAGQSEGDPTQALLNMARMEEALANAEETQYGIGRPTEGELSAFAQYGGEPGQQYAENVASERLWNQKNTAIDSMAAQSGGFEGLLQMLQAGDFKNSSFITEGDIRRAAIERGYVPPSPDSSSWIDRLGLRGAVEGRAMGGVIGYADGGSVPDPMMSAMGGYGMEDTLGPMGAMGMAGGVGMPDPLQVEYSQYMQGAEQLGLPAIPFEQFVQMKQMSIPQAPQAPDMTQPMGMMGFADGGMVDMPFMSRSSAIRFARGGGVPVDGKMVVDPDPNAPTDSIPAVIDGKRPAALDSGEFVIPRHAVMFHGIDKLNKLIAQAEKGPANESVSANA